MKFKTRLMVTFTVIVVLPLALTALAFCAIGLYLINAQKGLPFEELNYTLMAENMQEVVDATDHVYMELRRQAETDPSRLADLGYLEKLGSKIGRAHV